MENASPTGTRLTIESPVPTQPVMAQELNGATIGAIVAVAVAMLATLIGLVWALVRERRKHQRSMADLEDHEHQIREQHNAQPPMATLEGVPTTRPRNVLRRATFLPFGTRMGWDTLHSREDISRRESHDVNMPTSIFTRPVREKKRNSKRLSWPFSRQPLVVQEIPMQNVGAGRLSTVPESPLVTPSQQHFFIVRDDSEDLPERDSQGSAGASRGPEWYRQIRRVDSVSALRPDPLVVGKKRNRAHTMASAPDVAIPKTEPSKMAKRQRPTHMRSYSLGSQSPGSAPRHAVPPLPLTIRNLLEPIRPKSCEQNNMASRASVSSFESIGSSLLASPRLQRSASERAAKLQNGARRDYANSLISGPRPLRPKLSKRPQSSPEHNLHLQSLRGSIRSNVDSIQSGEGARAGSAVTNLSDTEVPVIKAAEAVRLSRVSLVPTGTPFQSLNTPRRQSRITVSENGSPAQRGRSVALREIPGNARLSRQLSQTSSAESTRSSNGNPFQFDPSPMASGKPSALKGSPNARKGHRRSQTVRLNISPQIINSKRGSSPLMADIAEESPENMAKSPQLSSSMGALPEPPASPRPPSTSTFEPKLSIRPSSFVASLTADSPTLSSMSFMQDHHRISLASSNAERSEQRMSLSSIFIPSFPSPGKAALTTKVLPTPTFSYTRPSNEIERDSPSTEAMSLLARPYETPQWQTGTPSASQADSKRIKRTKPATTEQFVFPMLVKEQSQAPDSPFEEVPLQEVDFASSPGPTLCSSPEASQGFTPQNWKHDSDHGEKSTSIPPPCFPKTSQLVPSAEDSREEHAFDKDVPLPVHSPSPIPGLNIYSSSLLSASQVEPPATELCSSIAALRRMNSDAKHDSQNPKLKATRRYQRMGRGESPDINSARDSVSSLNEIDEALQFGVEASDVDDSVVCGGSEDIDKENTPPATVWEHGEDYWKPKAKNPAKAIASSPLLSSSRDVSPLSTSSVQQRDNKGIQSPLVHRRVSQMRGSAILEKLPLALSGLALPDTPKINVQPPSSDIGSPASQFSFYDAQGFLVSEKLGV